MSPLRAASRRPPGRSLPARVGGLGLMLVLGAAPLLLAQQEPAGRSDKKPAPQKTTPFAWVNPPSEQLRRQLPAGFRHATFTSPSLKQSVGYGIWLPEDYDRPEAAQRRYPVVFYLHGGRPGNELKSVKLLTSMKRIAEAAALPPVIYVFVNGGPVSHYNLPDRPAAQGADVFIQELIPHIDQTYRTVADRGGRGLEGFSQGGRGTARLMFRYPELFCSASPGGGGHATEKRISESDGYENPSLRFGPGDNTWDLASAYAERRREDPRTPALKILVHVGEEGFNYQNNLEWMAHLESLGIPFEKVIVPGVGHSAAEIYQRRGQRIMAFHVENFRAAGALPAEK